VTGPDSESDKLECSRWLIVNVHGWGGTVLGAVENVASEVCKDNVAEFHVLIRHRAVRIEL
jgi:hypothetical protein